MTKGGLELTLDLRIIKIWETTLKCNLSRGVIPTEICTHIGA